MGTETLHPAFFLAHSGIDYMAAFQERILEEDQPKSELKPQQIPGIPTQ